MNGSGQTAVEWGLEVDPMIGRIIAGKYRVRARVGGGAMGVVYDAKQIALGKRVAIKVLNDDLQHNKHFVARFQVEAKAASLLDHANSTRVFDFGKDESGLLYICMEFLEGKNLLQLIEEQGPLPAVRIADLIAQTLAALARAHDLGILHRDLKPENIMVLKADDDEGNARDVVKVCDFGIAKFDPLTHLHASTPPGPGGDNDWSDLGDDAPSGPWKAAGSALTQVGLIIGTPDYMSPEQARGEPVDVRSEIYSVGVVLYHLLAGHVPFEGGDVMETLTRHMTLEPAPPSSRREGVDPELEAICTIAMSKDPAARYRTARDMRAALRSTAACRRVSGGGANMFSYVPSPLALRLAQADVGLTMAPSMAPALRAVLKNAPSSAVIAEARAAALPATVRAPAAGPALVAPSTMSPANQADTTRVPALLPSAAAGKRSTTSSRPALPVARLALQEVAPRRPRPLAVVVAAGLTAMFLGSAFALGARPQLAVAATAPPAAAPRDVEVSYAAIAAPLALAGEAVPGGGSSASAAALAVATNLAPGAATLTAGRLKRAAAGEPAADHGVAEPAKALPEHQLPFYPERGRVAVVREDAEGFDRHLVNELLAHAALEHCYVEALKAHGSAVTGSTVLTLRVEDGRVGAMSLGSSLGLDSLLGCLAPRIVGESIGEDGTAAGVAYVTLQLTDL